MKIQIFFSKNSEICTGGAIFGQVKNLVEKLISLGRGSIRVGEYRTLMTSYLHKKVTCWAPNLKVGQRDTFQDLCVISLRTKVGTLVFYAAPSPKKEMQQAIVVKVVIRKTDRIESLNELYSAENILVHLIPTKISVDMLTRINGMQVYKINLHIRTYPCTIFVRHEINQDKGTNTPFQKFVWKRG